jgi:hypothetical protein
MITMLQTGVVIRSRRSRKTEAETSSRARPLFSEG